MIKPAGWGAPSKEMTGKRVLNVKIRAANGEKWLSEYCAEGKRVQL